MNFNRILSTMLVLVMAFGAVIGVFPTFSVASHAAVDKVILDSTVDGSQVAVQALYQTYLSAQDKINTDPYMYKYAENSGYSLYCNPFTGEVYTKDEATGQILTTNPYYIGDAYASDTIPRELMSQFEVLFTKKDGSEVVYNSYDWSASRGQISATQLSNGVRLEYTVGDTTARYLVPNGISRERFETLILIPAQNYLISIIQEMIMEKRGNLDPGSTEDNMVYENDDDLRALCEWAANTAYYPVHNKRRVSWDFDEIMEYFYSFDPEESRMYGENIVDTFDNWYRLCYVYYKVLCGNNAKNYKEYSKMGNTTADYFSLVTMYQLQDPNEAAKKGEALLQDMQKTYPATKKQNEDGTWFALYALDDTLSNAKKRGLQDTIAKYAPEYTIDMMYEDEAETELEPVIEVNPVFRLSIEYLLSDEGVKVTLPANSIFYDESLYTLVGIDLLRYMGADDMNRGGYLFFPDGSGAIVDFEEFAHKNITLSGDVFGRDYSFHTLTGAHQEPVRMPVYGSVTNKSVYYFYDIYTGEKMFVSAETYAAGQFTYLIKEKRVDEYADDGETVISHYEFYYENDSKQMVWLPYETAEGENQGKQYWVDENGQRNYLNAKRGLGGKECIVVIDSSKFYLDSFTDGFLAILEDGATLCSLSIEINGASNNPYAAIFPTFKPLPQDTYDLSEANSSASSVMFTVASKQKYQEDLVVRYVILSDEAKAAGKTESYVASYVGMANAYRAYLTDAATGVLNMVNEEVMNELPLYIETFGVMETIEKILTIPVEVKVALTSFEDIETMYKELSDAGVSNVKFRLTGYANGGMYDKYPVKLRWERKAGGKSGFRNLMTYVSSHAEQGMQIFPEFEFQYIDQVGLFDGIRWKKVAARSVDNRYASKRTYSPYLQEHDSEMQGIIVAPTMITKLFDKFNRRYQKYGNESISLGTVAGELNSSYDEDDTVLREDAMKEMQAFLAKVSEQYGIMSEGGNVYALKYIDHLLNAPIDSSHFRSASYTVPFFGMVMHGAFSYAGSPLNEDGNPDYILLRSIENGASLYFILSYANTQLMKEDPLLSEYYSVNYQIWKDDVVKYYDKLNNAIGGLQDYVISHHEFLTAERLISDAEILSNRLTMEKEYIDSLRAYAQGELAAVNADLALLREFYNESIDKMIKDEIDRLKVDMSLNGEEIPMDFTATKSAELNELIRGNQNYGTYLEWVDENRYDLKKIMLPYIKTLTDNGSKLFDRLSVPAGATYEEKADYLMRAIVDSKTVLLLDSQITGINLSYDSLLAEALYAFGVAADSTLEDVLTFKADLAALVAELNRDAKVEEGYESGEYVIALEKLGFTPKNRFITYSYAGDEDYERTVYTVGDGSISVVTYQKGDDVVRFILNYNMFAVRVTVADGEVYDIPAQDFAPMKK